MSKSKKISLEEKIMNEIDDGEISMKPPIYFTLVSVLMGLGISLSFFSLVMVVNFIFHWFTAKNPFDYLMFGKMGINGFFLSFPWVFFLFGAVAIVFSVYLLKKYDFSYKKNIRAIIIGALVFVLTTGLLFDRLGFNRFIASNRLTREIYSKNIIDRNKITGIVREILIPVYIIDDQNNNEIKVICTEKTVFPKGDDIMVGDRIVAIGKIDGSIFYAEGIVDQNQKLLRRFNQSDNFNSDNNLNNGRMFMNNK